MYHASPNPSAVIGGSGFTALDFPPGEPIPQAKTPYGEPSAPPVEYRVGERRIWFIPRHGTEGAIPPHRVNYRANLWALHERGARFVVALNAVGGIKPHYRPGALVLPDQLIDYTHGREHTYFDGPDAKFKQFADFTEPYSRLARDYLREAAARAQVELIEGGCYAAMSGPRLETAAEINRLERDGADMVGMTGMPEAALARELGLDYASLCIVVNPAAGRAPQPIEINAILACLEQAKTPVLQLLEALFSEQG